MPTLVTNDGVTLQYSVCGDAASPSCGDAASPQPWCLPATACPPPPTVVLVHGWSGSSKYFNLNVNEVSRKGLRVIAYDQRFHGDSDKPDHGLHVARLAADLLAVLTHLDLQDVTVVGTSMGCSVIWSYIELFGQERLRRAVFVDQAPLQNSAPDWQCGSKGCYDAASLKKLQAALHTDMLAFAKGNGECCASLPLDVTVEKTLVDETLKCHPAHLAQLMADHTQLDWRPVLQRIAMPCLNMIGCVSGVFPVEGCEAVSALIPECQSVYFKHANHWLYLEEPDAFNALLVAFTLGETIETVAQEYGGRVAMQRP